MTARDAVSVVECPRGTSGCIETGAETGDEGWGLDTLAGARYSTDEQGAGARYSTNDRRWSSAREGRAGVSRPVAEGWGLDTLAGARYSTNDRRWSSAREGRAGVSRPVARGGVSIRSLALATRPTKSVLALATRPTNEVAGARYSTNEGRWSSAREGRAGVSRPVTRGGVSIRSLALATRPTNRCWRSLLDQRGSVVECPRGTSGCIETGGEGWGLDTLAGARYSTDEQGAGARHSTNDRRWSSAREGRAGVSRPVAEGWGLDTLAGARYSTDEGRWSSAREGRAGVSRPVAEGWGLDTLAGARYSTDEGRWSSAREERAGVSRPKTRGGVSIRSLALATRPTRVGGRVPVRDERVYRDR